MDDGALMDDNTIALLTKIDDRYGIMFNELVLGQNQPTWKEDILYLLILPLNFDGKNWIRK